MICYAPRSLDRIKVPLYKWHYSPKTKELYRYDQGVFEAYEPLTPQIGLQPTDPTRFYLRLHLKVLPEDALRAKVHRQSDHFELMRIYKMSTLWREVTSTEEIETIILQRNRRHLQQASIEDGRVHDPIMQELIEGYGVNDMVEQMRGGELTIPQVTNEAIQAWLSALNQTGASIRLPPITGKFEVEDFQSSFKAVEKKTYVLTIWRPLYFVESNGTRPCTCSVAHNHDELTIHVWICEPALDQGSQHDAREENRCTKNPHALYNWHS